jgi:hypothetical protein
MVRNGALELRSEAAGGGAVRSFWGVRVADGGRGAVL